MRLVYLSLLLLLYAGLLQGQNYTDVSDYFSVVGEHFSVKDGLPSQVIYTVLQDRKGFLWIGTDAGVSRYDGRNFVNFTTKDGLGDNEILDLYEDSKGRIWFKPFTGRLSYYANNTIYCDHNDPVLATIKGKYLNENTLCEDAAGTIYIPRRDSLRIAMIRSDHTLSYLNLSEKLENTTILSLFSSDNKEHLYCQTPNSIIDIHAGGYDTLKRFGASHVFFPTFASRSVLYLNDKGLHAVTNEGFRLLIPASALVFDNSPVTHTDILMDASRNIWISNSRNQSFLYPYSAGYYQAATPVLEGMPGLFSFDHENNIWVYDKRNGLYKIPFDRLLDQYTWNLNQQLLQKQVISCYTDSRGCLWLGYNNGWVTRMKNGNAEHFDLNTDTRRSDRVVQITEDRQGVLWFAMDGILSAIIPSPAGRYHIAYRNPDLGGNKHLFMDSSGNAYCVKLGPNNIARLAISHHTIQYKIYNYPGDYRTFSGFIDAAHVLYVGELAGLKRVENDKTRLLYKEDPRFTARIQHFAENKGVIFLATYNNGLIAMKDDRIIATTGFREYIPGITCRRIYIRQDTLYVATNIGIGTLFFEKNKFRLLRNITVLDGLLSNDVYDLCFLDHTLYAATSEGLSVITLPLKPWKGTRPTPVSILSFKADDKTYPTDKPVQMSYEHRNIRLTFVAPVMDKPELLLYRYRFVNRDKNWTVTTGNSIEYSDLSFGKYRLEIQAKKYNSSWSASEIIHFTILPPWYLTWWFISIVVAFALVLAYFLFSYVVRLRVRRTLREREVIEKERSRIAADLHDDIGVDLTNLVMLSGMMKNQQDLPPRLINKLENSSHEIINKMNEIIWMLNNSHDNMFGLVSYLNRYAEHFLEGSGLSYSILIAEEVYTDKVISSELRRNLFLAYKEVLHNIVKHSGADTVNVEILIHKKLYLKVIIRDNGKGFDTGKRYMGNGLVNLKKRIVAIHGSLEIESGPGNGCVIVIDIPYE